MAARLEATNSLKDLIKGYYDGLFAAAAEGRPTAWLNVGVPCEIFYAMDIFPFYPGELRGRLRGLEDHPEAVGDSGSARVQPRSLLLRAGYVGHGLLGRGAVRTPCRIPPSRWTP